MTTITLYKCDSKDCGRLIQKPEDGLVVHGNIYVADPSHRGGLIGNNFPHQPPEYRFKQDEVEETVFCIPCFMKAIGHSKPTTRGTIA